MRPTLLACLCLLAVATPAHATSRTGLLLPEFAERYDAAQGVIVPVAPTTYALHRGHHRIPLAPDPRYVAGAKLRVRGQLDAAGLLVPDGDDRGVKVLKLPPQTPAFPVEHLLVLPVAHPGSPATRTRASLAADFDALAYWVGQSSYGHTTMEVTVLDWRTTPLATDCSFGGLLSQALDAHAGTVNYRAYTLILVVEADGVTCADGSGGAGGGVGRMSIETPDGPAFVGTAITGAFWAASLHEVGHAMNLGHANSLDCAAPGPPPADLAGCVNREYGDPFDLMGQALGDFHVLHKRQLGWLRSVGPETLTTVTTDGVYVIEPLDVPSLGLGPKGLLLPLPTTPLSWLVVEARRPIGLDRLYPDDWLDGVLLHVSVAGFPLPDLQGVVATQGPTSSHFVWPTGAHAGIQNGRLATGYTLEVWPWGLYVQYRDPVTKVVTLKVADLRTCCASAPNGIRTCTCY
ncbi:MAG TPA: hypothetical protein VHK64_03995 [Nocardioidaceae bacterium]|nr:hypothetical protein [Nocardioidaceae bacterium]